MTFTNVIA